MRLAAVFIEDQDSSYPNRGYTVNLGGDYFYDVAIDNGVLIIKSSKNNYFIENFFDENRIVTNVSAIVGSNGAGKTSLIYELIDHLEDHSVSGISIWESKGESYIINLNIPLPQRHLGPARIRSQQKDFTTVYYSPFLDHKRSAKGIDISADRYLREDLNNINSTFDANSQVVIDERLRRADYQRFIAFRKSEVADAIQEKYGLLNDSFYRVVFTRHKIKANEKGLIFKYTPIDFQDYLNKLFLDIRAEYEALPKDVYKEDEVFEIDKKKFKNFILMDLFCLLIAIMETAENKNEGYFNNKRGLKVFSESKTTASEKLKYWLNNYSFSGENEFPLPNQETIDILNYLYTYIDSLKFSHGRNFLNFSMNSLFFPEEELNSLFDLNDNLLSAIPEYFRNIKKNELLNQSVVALQYFARPEYAERKLSSGETALLNLYSRLYDFFDRYILRNNIIGKKDYYIMFLDEADLGYHPQWKKAFVESIIKFSSEFFKKVEAKVQIIFTSHDPLALSDIPNSNVVYLHEDYSPRVMPVNDQNRPKASFGANINDLLGHSFFLDDLLIGDFANRKINDTINWINKMIKAKNDEGDGFQLNTKEFEENKKLVSQIEEPVLRNKLIEMISEIKVDESFIRQMIENETMYLENILKNSK